ncbi:CTP synthase [Candidatus Kaiserbacteria bacterium RIFCSPHIGHO2_02_FULL_59_21]|uniref:CTP synthase n=1 Tax=Candidatus Kaiserbacteria bacterium RIFCSPHIGHO2_02_FULL_59_21 TaxID=1798500 RepID=A0A1F6E1B2_9BACT|nr:MAG: CTP synthase [Candidatus Kaiserbacteria bacterium RIFCSPHIGHO2_01_FULL_58_22]OGG67461.1 MAG: CTP synthase [Candidatus Kaiserbacteria bacterium RIFCSPHIGHO2_02_FULL_59_21]OGG87058.1 MAG: CTP synthase [Candidatus Kaiserbacteria bacterium RIFCSPLOWO2_02_FULL_59_19]
MKRRAQGGHKYIFVVGGVMSGVGKGIATASIGKLLTARGLSVNLVKIDPYLNVDAGTMNPIEHGEVFVLDSGLETDQDMGNYERFLGRDEGPDDYMTSGMVYASVIARERNLGYGGKCVETIPHVRDEVIDRLKRAASVSGSDVSVIEIGGTVGDFQNALYVDAARVMHLLAPGDTLFVMVSYLPVPGTLGEMKTKPTQNAVRMLNSYGVQPDVIIARSKRPLDRKRKEKLAISCNVHPDMIISAPDVESIYDVPLNFERDKLSDILLEALGEEGKQPADLSVWKEFAEHAHDGDGRVKVGIVGKYFDTGDFVLSDAYISVIEALKFSAYAHGVHPELHWLNAKDYEADPSAVSELKEYDGILVPGGFGETGIDGKIAAVTFAREEKIPYFGLCYGMQLMTVEYARNVAGLTDAHTTEINPNTPHPVIMILPEQVEKLARKDFGGSMRLGAYPCELKKGTIAREAYGKDEVSERHRHRYEVNPEYIERLTKAGLVFSGVSPDRRLMEIAELPKKEHPFMLGTQFHPEFRARPLSPHPLFSAFIKAAVERKGKKKA